MPLPRISRNDLGELAFWGYVVFCGITLVVLVLVNLFSAIGFYGPEVLLGLVGSATVALFTTLATMIVGWWTARASSTRSEQEIKASIEDATSQALRSPVEILQRASLLVEEASRDGSDGMLLVCLPSPILYHDLYGTNTSFCRGLLQRAKDDWPTLVCFCAVDGYFSREEGTWQKSRLAQFYAALCKVAPKGRGLSSYRDELLGFFDALFGETRNLPSTRRNFLLCPLPHVRHQFVMRLKDRGIGRYFIEDWMLFFTDVEAMEVGSEAELLHTAYASRLSQDLARNVLDQFCHSLREPSSAYSTTFIRAADIIERKRVTGIPSTRSIITSAIMYASHHLRQWKGTDPHALDVLSFRDPKALRDQILYSPCLFLPPFVFNGEPDASEETLNSSPALSKYVSLHGMHLAGKTILEIGCGSGAVTTALASVSDVKIIALDNDERAIAACRATLSARGKGGRGTGAKLLCVDAATLVFGEACGQLYCQLEGANQQIDVIVVDLPLVSAPAGRHIGELERPYIAHRHEESRLPCPLAEVLKRVGKVFSTTAATIVTSLFVETENKACKEPRTTASLLEELGRLVPGAEIEQWSPDRRPSDLGDIIDVFVLRGHGHANSA